ncbi:VWA domain-containing protein [Prauserella oleivorans]
MRAGDPHRRAGDAEILGRVFGTVFARVAHDLPEAAPTPPQRVRTAAATESVAGSSGFGETGSGDAERDGRREVEAPTAGSAVERLASRDFADLDADELARLAEAMRALRIATPLRRSRRERTAATGARFDMRETLRRARRTGAEPVLLRRQVRRWRPRRLVVLCDISGSMQAHARAMLQLLVCAAGGADAEVFTFATRLTRVTHVLRTDPATVVSEAGKAAPDWSGGTRIGATLREFLDRFGSRGMARGAVVVVISDGWEAGDPGELGEQMARLSRLAHRVVWVNPRTSKPGYRPLAGGMAAAWPYCDAVVSGHRLEALDPLLTAIAAHRV